MRVRAADTIFFFPDALVVLDAQFTDADEWTLINPRVFVEVASHSTYIYDRITKLDAYKRMPSVQEVLIADQFRVRLEHHARVSQGWLTREFEALGDAVNLTSVGCTLTLSDVYAKVKSTS